MSKDSTPKIVNRIIDANINRAKEGLRVCEEVVRFVLNSPSLTAGFKKIRHEIEPVVQQLNRCLPELLKERKALTDVGKNIYIDELKRKDIRDIFYANMQRVKESVRVLEEFAKLVDTNCALGFKRIRYGIYDIEKKAAQKLSGLHKR